MPDPQYDFSGLDEGFDFSGLEEAPAPVDERSTLGRLADTVVPSVLRVGGAIVGGVGGGLVSSPTVLGIPAAVIAGGAAGSAAGEALAQEYEIARGLRTERNPTQTLVQGGIGAVPVFGRAGGVVKTALSRGAQGAALGGVGHAATEMAEGRTPTLQGTATAAAAGTVLGGGAGAVEGRMLSKAAQRRAAETAALTKRAAEEQARVAAAAAPPQQKSPWTGEPLVQMPTAVTKSPLTGEPVVQASGAEHKRSVLQDMAAALRNESGQTNPDAVAAVAGGLTGGAAGATEGDTPLERMQNTALGAAAGVATGLGASAAARKAGILSRRTETPPTTLPAARTEPEGGRLPLRRAILDAKVAEMSMVKQMPEEMREGVLEVIKKNHGFTDKRRDVQPLPRTKALAEMIEVQHRQALPNGTALNAEELLAYANATATIADRVKGLSAKVAAGQATDVEKALLQQARYEQTVITGNWLGARAEAGRALGAQRLLASVIEARDTKAIRDVLRETGEDLEAFAARYAEAPDDIARLKVLQESQKTTLTDKVMAVRYASILSGVKTQIRNTVGNTLNNVFSVASHPAGVAYDAARSAVTGAPRTLFMSELPSKTVGAVAAVPEALQDMFFALRHGFTPRALRTFDVPTKELGGGGKNPFNWVGRSLQAQDAFFRTVAYQQELLAGAHATAKAEALKKGLKGKALEDAITERMAELKLNPTPALLEQAERYAERAVFQENPGKWGDLLIQAKQIKDTDSLMAKAGRLALGIVMPFVRTPANILRQSVEATPLGLGMAGVKSGGRTGAQAVGRSLTGSAVGAGLGLLAYHAAQNLVTGAGPRDPAKRQKLMEEGWRPNSVRIGDMYIPHQELGALGLVTNAIGNAVEQLRETGDEEAYSRAATRILAATAQSALARSYIAGLEETLNAIQDPERYADRWLETTAAGFVPASGLLRNVTQAVDPVVRDPQGVGDAVKSILPGASTSVKPRLTRLGDDVTRPGGPLLRGFSPYNYSPDSTDDVVVALKKKDLTIPVLPKKLAATAKFPGRELTIEEQRQIGRAEREALRKLFRRSNWDRLDTDAAARLVSRTIADVRATHYRRFRQRKGGAR